ncbi:ParB N-terminal domain-containing protein [Candidatus Woesearchaeota archaeon]|nr:ParB N-terminal domain-containing protein [Candidatus Woesearchaeota archaeon]
MPYENNPRNNKRAIDIVAKSIKQFGFKVPVILDKKNVIIAGHTRIQAALKLGIQEVPVIYADDLTKEQIDAFRIMENKSQEYSKWDFDKLAIELKDLDKRDYDLEFTGLSEGEINRILHPKETIPKGGKEPKYKVKEGQVFILGKHRLICGDSTKPKTFEKLMKGQKADMVYTDPPYGVSYSGINNPNGRDWKVIDGDNMRGDELYDMLHLAFENVFFNTVDNPALYIFHASSNQIIFEKALNQTGFTVKQQLIWNKHHVLGHSHYHWTHEPIFYCAKGNKTPNWYGTRANKTITNEIKPHEMTEEELRDFVVRSINAGSVIACKKDNATDYIHPTQKPAELAEKMIINSSKAGQIVLEPFAGSGSTLIACEKRQRKCYAVEMDPTFCSHIIERWEEFTGNKHEVEDGQ